MEELRILSLQYYKNTVGINFFGMKGILYILLSLPFLFTSLWLSFSVHTEKVTTFTILVCGFLWQFAKKEYEYNLIRKLTFYTHLENKDISEHKALYLHILTSHISDSLFNTMKIFKEIIETDNKNKKFTHENIGYFFLKFIYDPESKNRILSLSIYLISLIAVLTVVKPEYEFNVYEVIHSITFELVQQYFLLALFIIIFVYFLIVLPLMFITTYFIVPVLLWLSFKDVLSRFFISELTRYSYLEQKILARAKTSDLS